MTLTSPDVLDYVRNHPGCTSKDIADHFNIPLTTVSSKTSRLFVQGYITREPEDLRQAPRRMCYRLWAIS